MKQKRKTQITSRIMSAIPSKDTEPELLLRRALWNENLRYRKNYKGLPGKPDIVFTKYHLAVFCDGDFWHEELESYSDFWRKKILRNIDRDNEINQKLRALGWTVLRFWESDIRTDVESCVITIKEMIFEEKIRK